MPDGNRLPQLILGEPDRTGTIPLPVLHGAILVLLALVLWLLPAGLIDLRGADETRYVLVAREWLAGHSLLGLTIFGVPYDQKPPLPFWFLAFMISVCRDTVSNLAVRLPSIILGLAAVLATWRIGRRHFGARAGFLSALILMTSWQWMTDTPTAELNIMFSGWITLSLAAWYLRPEGRISFLRGLCLWGCLAAAFFTKGPLALLIVLFVLGTECRLRGIRRVASESRLVSGVLLNAVLIAAWLVGQRHVAGAEFVSGQVTGQTVDRFLRGNHAAPIWYYIPRMLTTIMLPWSLLLIPVGVQLWKRRGTEEPVVKSMVIGWIALPMLVLTLAAGKRSMYVLPLLPAFALLIGRSVDGWIGRDAPVRSSVTHLGIRALAAIQALLGVACLTLIAVAILRPEFLWHQEFYLRPWQFVPAFAVAAAFLVLAMVTKKAIRQRLLPVCSLALSGALAGFVLLIIVRPALNEQKSSRLFAAEVDAALHRDQHGHSIGLLERAAKPEYHVYGRYTGVSLDNEDLDPVRAGSLPPMILVRSKDDGISEKSAERLAACGYSLKEWMDAAGDRLALYSRSSRAQSPDEDVLVALTGDTGRSTDTARNVAAMILKKHLRDPLASVILMGDNLYGYEPFAEAVVNRFENQFGPLLKQGIPIHAVLGNHDLKGGFVDEELAWPGFGMKGRRYYEETFGNGLATFYFLDNYTLSGSPDQYIWLKRRLDASTSRWKFLVMHEPLATTTEAHEPSVRSRRILEPFLGPDGDTQAVFAGHLHYYERPLDTPFVQVICGSGSKADGPQHDSSEPTRVLYDKEGVFVELTITEDSVRCAAISESGVAVDRFAISTDGIAVAGDRLPRPLETASSY